MSNAMYTEQSAKVRWKGSMSDSFSISNGVKQGAVLSAILFCIYIDGLIKEIRRKREGCWVNGAFLGIIVYADDIALLSPSIDGLQNMVSTCERYAESHNLTFSTHENPAKSKTKCVAFLREKRTLRNLLLKGKALPWVDSVKHLGTTLTNSNGCSLDQDLLEKRARYVSKNNELRQEFYFAHFKTKIWTNNVYNTSFYGAPLWDYSSRNFEKLEKTWNVSARLMLNLPRNTHRYFIEPLTETHHVTKSIWSRFIRFISNVANGKKKALRRVLGAIENDVRSTTGKNLRTLRLKSVDGKNVYDKPYKEMPENDQWRLSMAKELMEIKCGEKSVDMINKEVDKIVDYVCGE